MSHKQGLKSTLLIVVSILGIGLILGFALMYGISFLVNYYISRNPQENQSTQEIIADSKDKQAIKILFIGNSLTYFNVMPLVLARFIEAGLHKPAKVYQVCVPGESLKGHWTTGRAQRLIAHDGPWDYVILQGASNEPPFWYLHKAISSGAFSRKSVDAGIKSGKLSPDYVDHIAGSDNLQSYAKRFNTLIKAAHAKTILFETWADKNQGDMQRVVTACYTELGAAVNAPVVPIGEAFFFASGKDDKLHLYSSDNHHPAQAGTYLGACVLYDFLFQQAAHGMPGQIELHDSEKNQDSLMVNLSAQEADELQSLAWSFYQQHQQPK